MDLIEPQVAASEAVRKALAKHDPQIARYSQYGQLEPIQVWEAVKEVLVDLGKDTDLAVVGWAESMDEPEDEEGLSVESAVSVVGLIECVKTAVHLARNAHALGPDGQPSDVGLPFASYARAIEAIAERAVAHVSEIAHLLGVAEEAENRALVQGWQVQRNGGASPWPAADLPPVQEAEAAPDVEPQDAASAVGEPVEAVETVPDETSAVAKAEASAKAAKPKKGGKKGKSAPQKGATK